MNPDLQSTLARAGKTHVRHRVLTVLLKSLPWAVLAILLVFALDILLHLPAGTRVLIRNGLTLITLGLLATALIFALVRRPPILRVARMLEDRMPQLDSRLMNVLQLEEQAADPNSPPLTRSLAQRAIDDAARDLPMAEFRAAARPQRTARRLAIAATAPAILLLATFFTGEPGVRQWARIIDPHGDHPPISFTTIRISRPQNDGFSVPYRDGFDVHAETSGHHPRELFLSGYRSENERLFTLPMARAEKGLFTARVEDLREPLHLVAHTQGEKDRSHRRLVDVILEPRIERAWSTVTPPAYTGRDAKRLPFRFSGLRAMKGGEIEFSIESNRPLGSGRIVYQVPGREDQEFPLTPAPEGPAHAVHGKVPALASGRLEFFIVDVDGRPADTTPTSSLTITHDGAPAIGLLAPTEDTFVVENMTISLIAEATDDIGLASVRLHHAIDGKFVEPESARFDPPGERRHRLDRQLDLPALGLKAGQTITVFADAMDVSPAAQVARTETRTLTLITEDEYNDYLRREADVALISGKYEELLERFRHAIEEQEAIENELIAARELPPEKATAAVGEALQKQEELNRRLERLAEDMREIPRDNPVYDFEENLKETLEEHAKQIEDSVAQNREDLDQALEGENKDPNAPVSPEELEQLQQAARDQIDRLRNEQEEAEQNVQQPLEDLADFHEMLKDFNQLRNLAEQQRQLAEQAAAADRGQEELTPEDKAALRDLANRQRQLGQQLEQLQEKLRQDAERMREDMPEVAEAAEQLADAIENGAMPGQARDAAGEMLEGNAPQARQEAEQLQQQLQDLMEGAGQQGQQAAGEALAQMLQAFGMGQGQNFQQLLQSLRFTPPGMGMAQGGGGQGTAGMQAQGMMNGQPQSMLGGESLKGGDIARRLAGIGQGGGMGLGPSVAADSNRLADEQLRSSRRTSTPEATSLFSEYDDIADAYFQRLTTPSQ